MDAKIYVLLALLTIVSCRDLIVGSNDSGHKIYEEDKKANPAIWRQTENVTITAADGEIISKLIITDLRNEKDGDVKIVEGGEGQQNVTVELKSPTVLRGYEFHIEAFAVSNNGQAGGPENGHPQKPLKKNEDEMNTSTRVSLTPLILLTSENPLSSSEKGETNVKRQNREVENKDKSIQPPMHPLTYTSTTNKVSQVQSTVIPNVNENKEDKERKFPVISGEHENDNKNQPRINLQQPNKASESTGRYIPLTEFKTDVNHNHQEGANINNDMTKHTSVDYPKFYIHEINTAAPVINKDLNKAGNDTKNESFRQKRDVIDVQHKQRVNIKDTDNSKDEGAIRISEKNESNNQKQTPLQENSKTNPQTSDVKNIEDNRNSEHTHYHHHHHTDQDTKYLAEGQSRPHTFKGRQIPRRFGFNEDNQGTRNSESSTDISKISTLLPANTESKTFNDQNEKTTKTNAMNVPKVITNEKTLTKEEGTTVNKQVPDNTDKINGPLTVKENERPKRDIIGDKKDNKEISKPIIENFSISTPILQPSIIKNAAVDDPSKLEIPVEIPSAKDTNKKDNLDTVTEEKKNNDKKLFTPNSSTTAKLENKNRQIENIQTTEKQKNIQEPIGAKSEEKNTVIANITEQKERISRDTDSGKKIDKVENEKVFSATEVAKKSETEKLTKNPDKNAENKSPVPVTLGIKDQKQGPITSQGPTTASSSTESTPYLQGDSKYGTIGARSYATNEPVKDQSPKFLRETRKADSKGTKASLDLNKENIAVSADSSVTKHLSDITILKKTS